MEIMCAEEAQEHRRRLAEERARLLGKDPRGHREGGQLLQEPGGAGGQAGSGGHQALRVLPVAGGLREVQDQRPQGGQSGAACQHRALLAGNGHRAVIPAGGRRSCRRERGLRGPFMGRETPPCVRPFGLASRPSILLSAPRGQRGLGSASMPFSPGWHSGRHPGRRGGPRGQKRVLGAVPPPPAWD